VETDGAAKVARLLAPVLQAQASTVRSLASRALG
jgi:hypothetical protein